jgi:hypothetical protein
MLMSLVVLHGVLLWIVFRGLDEIIDYLHDIEAILRRHDDDSE